MIPHAHPKIETFKPDIHCAASSRLMESSVPATEPLIPQSLSLLWKFSKGEMSLFPLNLILLL